jgi:hypothetical protein
MTKEQNVNIRYNIEQIKVKLCLCLIQRHAMPDYGGAAVQVHAVLTSALDGGDGQLHSLADATYRERK